MITSYKEGELPKVLELVNRVQNHLTAGIVSNDQHFLNEVLGNTINGTIYAGIRARTTGAPQQMWFGPSGDPRSGVGTRHSGCSPVQYQAAGLFRGYAPCVQGCGPLRPRLQLHATCTCHAHAHAHAHVTCVCTLSPGGIHTPEAIKLVWSSHREILYDYGPVPADHAKTQS